MADAAASGPRSAAVPKDLLTLAEAARHMALQAVIIRIGPRVLPKFPPPYLVNGEEMWSRGELDHWLRHDAPDSHHDSEALRRSKRD